MRSIILICLALMGSVLSDYTPTQEPVTTGSPTPQPTTKSPRTNMDPAQLIKYWGYPASSVQVDTKDGYILTLYRIQHGRNDTTKTDSRPVVLLLHGFGTSAADWVINTPSQSAAFIFADGGFDVYIASFRGTLYSRGHKTWDPSTDLYWQFSWDEMAQYDLPAIIDAALQNSKAQQLYLVAHSTGTTVAMAMLSQPGQTKVRQLYAIAPVIEMSNVQGPLKFGAPFLNNINIASALFGVDEFEPNSQLQQSWAKYVCADPATDITCQNGLLMLAGPNTRQIDQSQIDVINGHSPGGASVRTLVHICQMITSGNFQSYDYGNPKLNQQHYGRTTPPLYNLASLQTATFFYSSECDWVAEPLNVANTANMLGTKLYMNVIVPSFNHMDFIWGTRAASEVYEPILALMGQDYVMGTTKAPTP